MPLQFPSDSEYAGVPGNFSVVTHRGNVFLTRIVQVDNEEQEVLVYLFKQFGRDSTLSFSIKSGMIRCNVPFTSVLHLIEKEREVWRRK